MENGRIPLRHGSLPGSLRLPKRFERFAQGKQMAPSTNRKLSVTPSSEEPEGERFHDLMQAILWIKQELILLRQHDILLKRQFTDIQETINSLSKTKHRRGRNNMVSDSNTSLQSNSSSDFGLDNYSVRSASSVTALDDSDILEHDILADFRPRTSSMKTTRDLAALARRRGSKELI